MLQFAKKSRTAHDAVKVHVHLLAVHEQTVHVLK